jgi:hypothetical protein
MQRLTRPDHERPDDGAIAVMVAVLLVVLLGAAAFAVDAGSIYWERRQLQNAADAAALALAAGCALDEVDCAAPPATLAGAVQPIADANAHDDSAGVPESAWHGSDPGECEPGASEADNPLTGANVVKVSTSTADAANDDAPFLTLLFARFLGVDTATVGACATAEWGWAASLTTIPLVISACDFDPDATPTFPGPHPNAAAPSRTIFFHQGTGPGFDDCTGPAGMDAVGDEFLPAGFGWLENDDCQVTTTVVDGEEWVAKDPGANPECAASDLEPLLDTVVLLPVFVDFCRPAHHPGCPPPNSKDKYRIGTYAAFYLQGYRLSGNPAFNKGIQSCSGSQRCLTGYFTTAIAGGGDIGGPPGGVIVVRLTG